MDEEYPFQDNILNDDVKTEILLRVPDDTLFVLCSVNKKTAKLCNENFWWRKFVITFGTDLKESVKNGIKINYRDIYTRLKKLDNEELFMKSAAYGYIDLIKLLVKQPELRNEHEYAMIWAAENGHLEIVKYFSEEVNPQVDIHAFDDGALRMAARNGHLNVTKYLVEQGGSSSANHADNDDAVRSAAEYGHLDVVKYLVEHGANIHALYDYAIIKSSEHGHLDVVIYLTEHGANIHTYGNEPIRLAALNGNLNVVKYLVEYDNANVPSRYPTILIDAINSGNLDLVKYLVEQGADYAADDMHPLFDAVNHGYFDIAKYLVDLDKETPLDLYTYMAYERAIYNAKFKGYYDIADYIENIVKNKDLILDH